MSDFDKEAERERLREKYERDQQQREATERMSDLLLKGATMTNAHCDTCGDPIFRYDGQEFCPTCEEVVTSDAPEDATDAATADGDVTETETTPGDGATPDASEAASPEVDADGDTAASAESRPGDDTDPDATADHIEIKGHDGQSATEGATGGADEATPSADAGGAGRGRTTGDPVGAPGTDETADPGKATAPATAAGEGDIATARESLERTLVAQARQAEQCEDPRRARDHLAAAREAAEALAALSY